MATSREEQLRNNRRFARQILGAVVVVLVIIGLFTVLGWGMTGLGRALDDSDKKESYADRLYGLVMFDTLPFSDVSSVDPSVFKQAAIWGTVYQIQKSGGSLDEYERDAETGCVILPKLEVDTYIANLLGSSYSVPDGAFETGDMNYQYSDEKQGYLVPITGSVGMYTPEVEKISTKGGKTYVTVGYIPTFSASSDLTFTAPTQPTKYMDYVFDRGENRQWFLTALQESEMQVEATSSSVSSSESQAAVVNDPQALVQDNLDPSLNATTENSVDAESTADGEAPADAEAQSDGTEPAPEEGEASSADSDSASSEGE